MIDLKSPTDSDPANTDHPAIRVEADGLPAGTQPAADQTSLREELGEKLRTAREAGGWDIAECAHDLRLPIRVLKKLEAGDHGGISEGVYLRNYVLSYGRRVGASEAELRDLIDRLAPAERKPELVSTGNIPHSHYLLQRYTALVAAAVLTALVVVPLVWLSFKGGLDRELAQLEPLDSAAVTSQHIAASGTPASLGVVTQSTATSTEKPLMASMAPFSALDSVDNPPPAPVKPVTPPAPPAADPDEHTLSITLDKPSWVEIITADGDRLEYSLLPAGAHKVYQSKQPLQVSIGDTLGAQVELDGHSVDLATYQHANVAHFRVAIENDKAAVQAM
ncbi:MAG TPA: helix-turn-helix domain-containing protein [Rhodanobacteraceae bacterium]